jgi:hypothetical protein
MFFDLRAIDVFKASILPERWDTIRSVEIHAAVYRKDDITDAVEATSRLQLEAWPAACTALESMPNLRMLKIFVGNARYLDGGYLAGGRRTDLVEVVLRFLGAIYVGGTTKVNLASKMGTSERPWRSMEISRQHT